MKTRRQGRTVLILMLVLAALPIAQAATLTVTNTDDSGPGSLRQAIWDAMPGDEIEFHPALDGLPIVLTSGQLVIDKDLDITGRGVANTILDGNASSRVFYVDTATVSISGVTVRNGDAFYGGGLFNWRGTLTLSDTAISGNSARYGGGISSEWGALTVIRSTLHGNETAVRGGAIDSAGCTLTVAESTISDNIGRSYGGGIDSCGDVLAVRDSTISGNSAKYGGGIFSSTAIDATIVHTTIAGNRGGGVFGSCCALTLSHSIVGQQAHGVDCYGPVVSLGHNLDSDGSCRLTDPTDLPDTDPRLSPLADNGGPTWTRAPLRGSPAIDAGSCPGRGTDQRGMPCPVDIADVPNVDDGCDIGAFEFGCYEGSITAPADGTCTADAVTVEDNYAEICDPELTWVYEPGPGPTYWEHGDYGVTLKVTDGVEILGEDSVDFSIDTVSPVVEWAGLPDCLDGRPLPPVELAFLSDDDDGATGEVVHEVMKLDGCLIYDGATYGENPNGLLSDEEIVLSQAELRRISRECGFETLVEPEIRVEATDCAGNLGSDTHTFLGCNIRVSVEDPN